MAEPRIEPYEREDGQWDWRLIGANNEEICSSLQGYGRKYDAEVGAERAKALMAQAEIVRF